MSDKDCEWIDKLAKDTENYDREVKENAEKWDREVLKKD